MPTRLYGGCTSQTTDPAELVAPIRLQTVELQPSLPPRRSPWPPRAWVQMMSTLMWPGTVPSRAGASHWHTRWYTAYCRSRVRGRPHRPVHEFQPQIRQSFGAPVAQGLSVHGFINRQPTPGGGGHLGKCHCKAPTPSGLNGNAFARPRVFDVRPEGVTLLLYRRSALNSASVHLIV